MSEPRDDDDEICGGCDGSGLGQYDGSSCQWCGGSGVKRRRDDDCDDGEDYADGVAAWEAERGGY